MPTILRAAGSTGLLAALALGILLAGSALPAAAAFTQEQVQTLRKISAYFNSIRTMQGEFVQIGPRGEQSEGVFFLSRPGKVRFQYRPPVNVIVIADGSTLAIEDRRVGTQDMYPLSKTPLKYLLSDKIDLASQSIVAAVREEADLISLVLVEDSMGGGQLTMIFDNETYELRQWVTTDAQGLDTSVAIYNVTTGQKPDPNNFRIYLKNQNQ